MTAASNFGNGSPIRIGTRGSPLALVQAEQVQARLKAAAPDCATEIVKISTTGDKVQDRRLAEIGGKGLFTKEIDLALLDGRIDVGVHSMKDVETILPGGTELAAILEREDPRDAFISPVAGRIDELPPGAIVGTASLRRQAQVLHLRPDLKVVLLRGNVGTRLEKLRSGAMQATFLALAGLRRLGREDVATCVVEAEEMLPAVGQGAIGLAVRTGEEALKALLQPLNHGESWLCVTAERAMLAALDGTCETPIGGLARREPSGSLLLAGLVAREDGSELHRLERRADPKDALTLGATVGQELRRRIGEHFFAERAARH